MLFRKNNRQEAQTQLRHRLPPGQSLTQKWPVLHYGAIPRYDLSTWDFFVSGLVRQPRRFTWDEFNNLPHREQVSDMHCVTRWSKLDSRFEGIPVAEVLKHVELLPEAKFVMVHADPDYTTNLPLEYLLDDDVMFVLKYEGQPLEPEHGYPVRLLVPKLYLWKSAKWVRGLEFMAEDRSGFWETYGYHERGDPWQEERFGQIVVNRMQDVRAGR
ncbi:MAG: Sulfoxide reductase catalytic subunit YedY [Anaerolineae bacterium]|nr:Sulfoxide reductase catalytic subunit YedY [Anaerolineae bacterium]